VFGTDIPSTRAKRPFETSDIDLVEKVLGPELAKQAFWDNPLALLSGQDNRCGLVMKIKANGITFNYDVTGTDSAPWLIFSNSLATNLHMWDQQVSDLKSSFRMLAYDQRGHGLTEAPPGRYTFELLCADVIALMDALGIKRARLVRPYRWAATGQWAWCRSTRTGSIGWFSATIPGARRPKRTSSGRSASRSRRRTACRRVLESTMQRWFPPETLTANPPHMDVIRR